MTNDEFQRIFQLVVAHVGALLIRKNDEYARGEDKLHNFKRAADVDGCTPIQAARGMQLKHSVSLLDMLDDLDTGHLHCREQWLEKIGDRIAYDILIYALLVDTDSLREPGVAPCQSES